MQALENSLVSMRAAVQRVQSRVKIPENSSMIEAWLEDSLWPMSDVVLKLAAEEVLPGPLKCSCLGLC